MRAGAGQVLLGQPFVEIDGGRYVLHDLGGAAGEPAAPHLVCSHGTPMTLPRFRPLTIAVAIGAAVLLVVLYGIATLSVHAPPASLEPLKLTRPAETRAFRGFCRCGRQAARFGRIQGPPCAAEPVGALVRALREGVAGTGGAAEGAAAGPFRGGGCRCRPRYDWPRPAASSPAHDARALPADLDSNTSLFRAFGAYGLPLSVLIDAQGREIARAEGPAIGPRRSRCAI